jgi:hypothetical protein
MARTLADVELLATRMVDEHWPAIIRVAEALLAFGELSGASIDALIHCCAGATLMLGRG